MSKVGQIEIVIYEYLGQIKRDSYHSSPIISVNLSFGKKYRQWIGKIFQQIFQQFLLAAASPVTSLTSVSSLSFVTSASVTAIAFNLIFI